MFQFLFQHPWAAFAKGTVAFQSGWPVWLLILLILAAAAALFWWNWRLPSNADSPLSPFRRVAIWLLQASLAALLLVLLWKPGLTVTALKPQQNIVAVLIDDSRSMALADGGGASRSAQAKALLEEGFLKKLSERFRVRLYRLGDGLTRVESSAALNASAPVSRIGEGLRQVASESASVPIGAVVLLTDGADSSGGIDFETVREVRSRRIPVHAIGFGRERLEKDVEIVDAIVPPRALAGSRLNSIVTIRHQGFKGKKSRITVEEGGKVLASREVTLGDDGDQVEPVFFNAGDVGAKTVEVRVAVLEGETNSGNNLLHRLLNVDDNKPRILYIEGEPRWEYKFIRRAIEEDQTLQIVSLVRTTQNKIYRQGIEDPKDLEEGFPAQEAELFAYNGLIIGNIEAASFTAKQIGMIRDFADRRGGGVLFLGGRDALTEGGYHRSPLAEVLPVDLPSKKGSYRRDHIQAELSEAGRDSLLCRLVEDEAGNAERWSKLPALDDVQAIGSLKPGATELLRTSGGPLLAIQTFGRGRVGVFGTGGSWRWQMLQDVEDLTHETFWQQLARWLSVDAPGLVSVSIPRQVLSDETRVRLRAEVRDKDYQPVSDARVEAQILGPDKAGVNVELRPSSAEPGIYTAEYDAPPTGIYLTEVFAHRGDELLGQDRFTFRREDGVAESFRTAQNRELLSGLARETGGSYHSADDTGSLADEIAYSEAGMTMRETKDLWNMPIVFLLILGLWAAEWSLRRKWGRI